MSEKAVSGWEMYQSEATLHQFHPNAAAFPIVLHNVYEHFGRKIAWCEQGSMGCCGCNGIKSINHYTVINAIM